MQCLSFSRACFLCLVTKVSSIKLILFSHLVAIILQQAFIIDVQKWICVLDLRVILDIVNSLYLISEQIHISILDGVRFLHAQQIDR